MQNEGAHSSGPGLASEGISIGPGATVGILGGGQLGRMFGMAARRMGYRMHAFEPNSDSPAGQVSDVEINAPYGDTAAVAQFARGVDVISFEFENIPVSAIEAAAALRPLRPRGEVLHICQNREREKAFLHARGFPHAPFAVVDSAESLKSALERIGTPAVLKTADFGYDGKGQIKLGDDAAAADVWAAFQAPRGVLEAWIPFAAELSVVVARGLDGQTLAFPPSENVHKHHILDLSIAPARFEASVIAEASRIARDITAALDVVGLLAVEFFLTQDGRLLVNELAPRPHNSGHFTLDACVTSQFEQQLRAVCGLPLGSPDLLSPVVMWNLLGHLWKDGEPDWKVILEEPRAKLHLYGKAEARPGRKMGHVCVLADVDEALAVIAGFKQRLGDG
ncbi:MAG TPA: 5-(carboxyamino)imidazole ribonucleotide synthase [Terrimicrobiaceae bacterium]|nr:5-(carboxyamino)imidazole ribonucleotide synthase [Terrimicrobiaceae bacterium]